MVTKLMGYNSSLTWVTNHVDKSHRLLISPHKAASPITYFSKWSPLANAFMRVQPNLGNSFLLVTTMPIQQISLATKSANSLGLQKKLSKYNLYLSEAQTSPSVPQLWCSLPYMCKPGSCKCIHCCCLIYTRPKNLGFLGMYRLSEDCPL